MKQHEEKTLPLAIKCKISMARADCLEKVAECWDRFEKQLLGEMGVSCQHESKALRKEWDHDRVGFIVYCGKCGLELSEE